MTYTPDSLRALGDDLGRWGDDETAAKLTAHADAWKARELDYQALMDANAGLWVVNATLRKRLEEAEDEKRGMKRRWDMACDDNAALRERLEAALNVVRNGRSDAAAFVSEANHVLALASLPTEVTP